MSEMAARRSRTEFWLGEEAWYLNGFFLSNFIDSNNERINKGVCV